MNIKDLQRSGLIQLGPDTELPFNSKPTPQIPPNIQGIISHLSSPTSSQTTTVQQHLQNSSSVSNQVAGTTSGKPVLPHYKAASLTGGRTSHSQDYYYRKWKRLKRLIKDTVFINASVCDEVIRIDEKLSRSKEERRYLLRKLLQYQTLSDVPSGAIKQELSTSVGKCAKSPSVASSTTSLSEVTAPDTPSVSTGKSKPSKKKASSGGTTEKKKTISNKELIDSIQPKPKKSKSSGASRRTTIPPIPLDPTGRPVFPLVLGDLTVHSLGELNLEKSCFHCSESIFPVGFCSTRVYANMNNTEVRCIYTCKISDTGSNPLFEIAPDDNPEKVWKSKVPGECHVLLTRSISKSKGVELTSAPSSGLDFFGLSHPIVQNLIQSLPGARKCSGYKWHKFEVNKGEIIENIAHCQTDPVVNFDALRKLPGSTSSRGPVVSASVPLEPSTNLRSLLTSGPFSLSMYTQPKQ